MSTVLSFTITNTAKIDAYILKEAVFGSIRLVKTFNCLRCSFFIISSAKHGGGREMNISKIQQYRL